MTSLVKAGAILLLVLASPAKAQMPPNAYFLKIDGVRGDVHDGRHDGWVRLTIVKPACLQPAEERQGRLYCMARGGGGAVFHITRHTDAFSALLAEAFRTGRHFAKLSIEKYEDFGGGDFFAELYTLSDAQITSLGTDPGDPAGENLTLTSAAVTGSSSMSEGAILNAH